MENCTIELSGGGKRAACVAVPFGPLGTDCQQLLVSRGGVLVSAGIAEHPGTEIGYIFLRGAFLRGPQRESDASAFGGVLMPSSMQQGFAKATKEDEEFFLRKIVLSEIKTASLDELNGSAQRSSTAYRCFADFIDVGHCMMFLRLRSVY